MWQSLMARHLYALGLLLLGAVCGVLALTLTNTFAIGAALCFVLGFAIERRIARRFSDAVASRLPFEVRVTRRLRPSPTESLAPALGILDFEARALQGMTRQTSIVAGMTRDQGEIGKLLEKYSPRFAKAANETIEKRIALSREFARKLDALAQTTESRERQLRAQVGIVAENYVKRIQSVPDGDPELPSFRTTVVEYRDTTLETKRLTSDYRQSLVSVRDKNLEQHVNEAFDRYIRVMSDVIADFDETTRYLNDALRVIDQKIHAGPNGPGSSGMS